jgi:hypothetical protein
VSDIGDYEGEMSKSLPFDHDVERLLSGSPPENEDLALLAPYLDAMRSEASRAPSEGAVAIVTAEAAATARTTRPTAAAPIATPVGGRHTGMQGRRSGSRLFGVSPKIAAVAAAVLFVSTMGGVSVAADSAAPGDLLYPLDRALENIGLGAGRAQERYREALLLTARGDTSRALETAVEGVEEDGGDIEDASAALRLAAESVASSGDGDSEEVRDAVAAMLKWMADNKEADEPVTGADFGLMVAEMARNIGGRDAGYDDAVERSEGAEVDDAGSGPPEGVSPGPPEGIPAGPPAGVPGP